jgi:hypothetical protein
VTPPASPRGAQRKTDRTRRATRFQITRYAAAKLGNGATSYYAKDVGLVLGEASGSVGTTTERLRGCAGSQRGDEAPASGAHLPTGSSDLAEPSPQR